MLHASSLLQAVRDGPSGWAGKVHTCEKRVVTACTDFRYNPMRVLLNNIRWGLMDEKLKGEETLRASGAHMECVLMPSRYL